MGASASAPPAHRHSAPCPPATAPAHPQPPARIPLPPPTPPPPRTPPPRCAKGFDLQGLFELRDHNLSPYDTPPAAPSWTSPTHEDGPSYIRSGVQLHPVVVLMLAPENRACLLARGAGGGGGGGLGVPYCAVVHATIDPKRSTS